MANYVESLKSNYLQTLSESGLTEKALKLSGNDIYTPLYQYDGVHPEEEPSLNDVNDIQYDIENDLNILSVQMVKTANDFKTLMETCKSDLDDVIKTISKEKEKQQDINILCNNYQDFADVTPLDSTKFSGDFNNADGVFTAKISQLKDITFVVSDVVGNGYEGNKYVYNTATSSFATDSVDTSNRKFINDGSIINVYEYSRITASNTEKDIVPEVNYDSLEAKCTLNMYSDNAFNCFKVSTDSTMVQITDVDISNDGIQYTSVISGEVPISNSDLQYTVSDYIPGSGIISFPDANYVRATFESTGYTTDTIAFNKTVLDTTSATMAETTSLITLKTAKRHVVKINDIAAGRNVYQSSNIFGTAELIGKDPAKCIALFASEYIPTHFDSTKDYITYTLTVKGTDYNIVPVNSNKNGSKIIRNSEYNSMSDYSIYLNEDIKSVYLKITITTPNQYETPYVSNIKLLIGR